ncbi:MAG: hypothetical protein V1813_00970 [Candidatus Aenigmatarchaeota archaeon]
MGKEAQEDAKAKAVAPKRRIAVRQRIHAFRVKAKAFAKRIAVKMLASAFVSFTIVFVAVSCVLLIFELVPWITKQGVTDIDPLPILIVSFILAFAAMYARFLLMKRFSVIRP